MILRDGAIIRALFIAAASLSKFFVVVDSAIVVVVVTDGVAFRIQARARLEGVFIVEIIVTEEDDVLCATCTGASL